nr:sugar transferase [uncultured Rhodopila sp.]
MPNEVHYLVAVDRRAEKFVRPRSAIRPHAKRLFDICAALTLIVIVLPVAFLVIAASLGSAQVPFCSNVRVGRDGQAFGCLKFRTTRRDADSTLLRILLREPPARPEKTIHRDLRDDPRVTRLGRFLVETNMNELPQLLNVLAGHMSFVGPQPLTRAELGEFYNATETAAYCSVRPGLTGLWQLGGCSDHGYRKRAALDILYVERLSLRNDLRILWRSIAAVVRQEAAGAPVISTNASGERHTR